MAQKDALMTGLRRLYAEIDAMTLATIDEQGNPHAATVYFATDEELNLYYLSDPAALHSRHIEARPTVAAAMQMQPRMWQQIRGVQLHGRVEAVSGQAATEDAWQHYMRRFPHIQEIENLARDLQLYHLVPTWVRCIDYSIQYGNQLESPWPASDESVRGGW